MHAPLSLAVLLASLWWSGGARAQDPLPLLPAYELTLARGPNPPPAQAPTVTPAGSQADPRPRSAVPLLVPGWIASGIGTAGFATLLIKDFDGAGIVVGAVGFLFGVPLLIAGYHQRAAAQEWRKRHPPDPRPDLCVIIGRDAARLVYATTL